MASKLFVGNLPYKVSSEDLEQMFSAHGTVESAVVIMDKFTNRSKGFGFVEMSSDDEAKAAISALNDSEVEGRKMIVSEARPQEKREPRDFGGDRGGYRPRDDRR